MPLAHLIYASAATRRFAASDLRQLLVRARAHNVSVGVTGMLLHIDGSFFQVLEGEAPAIARLYRTIGADERHCGLTLIIDEPIARRSFGEWSMGFPAVTPAELGAVEGLNDFFGAGLSLARLDPCRARKLLAAFESGRWRLRAEPATRQPQPSA